MITKLKILSTMSQSRMIISTIYLFFFFTIVCFIITSSLLKQIQIFIHEKKKRRNSLNGRKETKYRIGENQKSKNFKNTKELLKVNWTQDSFYWWNLLNPVFTKLLSLALVRQLFPVCLLTKLKDNAFTNDIFMWTFFFDLVNTLTLTVLELSINWSHVTSSWWEEVGLV